jgi:hypothetical protein
MSLPFASHFCIGAAKKRFHHPKQFIGFCVDDTFFSIFNTLLAFVDRLPRSLLIYRGCGAAANAEFMCPSEPRM